MIGLKVANCYSGSTLAQEQVQAASMNAMDSRVAWPSSWVMLAKMRVFRSAGRRSFSNSGTSELELMNERHIKEMALTQRFEREWAPERHGRR